MKTRRKKLVKEGGFIWCRLLSKWRTLFVLKASSLKLRGSAGYYGPQRLYCVSMDRNSRAKQCFSLDQHYLPLNSCPIALFSWNQNLCLLSRYLIQVNSYGLRRGYGFRVFSLEFKIFRRAMGYEWWGRDERRTVKGAVSTHHNTNGYFLGTLGLKDWQRER